VRDVTFDRAQLRFPTLSPAHARTFMEQNAGPLIALTKSLEGDAPRLTSFRREFEALVAEYFEDNALRQDFLITRAVKA
jgi:hypothetical protein